LDEGEHVEAQVQCEDDAALRATMKGESSAASSRFEDCDFPVKAIIAG
jgi:hypothetical protein